MDQIMKKMYELYISDTNNEHIEEDENYNEVTERLVQLENRLKIMLNKNDNSEKEINKVIDDFFNANNDLSSIYRYYDFEQGFVTGMAIGMMNSDIFKEDFKSKINEILNKVNRI